MLSGPTESPDHKPKTAGNEIIVHGWARLGDEVIFTLQGRMASAEGRHFQKAGLWSPLPGFECQLHYVAGS